MNSAIAKRVFICISSPAILSGCALSPPAPTESPEVSTGPTPGSPPPAPSPASPAPATPSATATPASPTPGAVSPSPVQALETRLSQVVTAAIGVPIQSVNCPAGANVAVDSRFDCEAVSDGQPFTIAVEVTNATVPQFRWRTKGLLVISKLEAYLQKEIKDRGGIDVTASCGSNIRVVQSGETFECQITDARGKERSARVTVKDEQGNVEVSLI